MLADSLFSPHSLQVRVPDNIFRYRFYIKLMARKGYRTIALPDELITEIDEVIKSKKRGYSSRAELVKDGVRQVLNKLKK